MATPEELNERIARAVSLSRGVDLELSRLVVVELHRLRAMADGIEDHISVPGRLYEYLATMIGLLTSVAEATQQILPEEEPS